LSRTEIPVLYANKWFKNVYGLLIADRLLAEIDQAQLARKYKLVQAEIVRRINERLALGLSASDAFLLAKLPAQQAKEMPADRRQSLAPFRRGDWYRFCLTPYFHELEAAE
jgi:hypothetical protein